MQIDCTSPDNPYEVSFHYPLFGSKIDHVFLSQVVKSKSSFVGYGFCHKDQFLELTTICWVEMDSQNAVKITLSHGKDDKKYSATLTFFGSQIKKAEKLECSF